MPAHSPCFFLFLSLLVWACPTPVSIYLKLVFVVGLLDDDMPSGLYTHFIRTVCVSDCYILSGFSVTNSAEKGRRNFGWGVNMLLPVSHAAHNVFLLPISGYVLAGKMWMQRRRHAAKVLKCLFECVYPKINILRALPKGEWGIYTHPYLGDSSDSSGLQHTICACMVEGDVTKWNNDVDV